MNNTKILKNSVRLGFYRKCSKDLHAKTEVRSSHVTHHTNNTKTYYVLHRERLPAYINRRTGESLWFINGQHYTTTSEYYFAMGCSPEEVLIQVILYGHVLPKTLKDLQ